MNQLASVIARSGILKEEEMDEFRRWKTPGIVDLEEGESIDNAAALVAGIEQALQSKELVLMRATDLDIVPQFLRTQQPGSLYVTVGTESADFPITFGRSSMGDYIMPWTTDLVEEVLTNGEGHLVTPKGNVFFSSVNVLYFGETKTFLLCTPTT